MRIAPKNFFYRRNVSNSDPASGSRGSQRGFSLAEMMIVVGLLLLFGAASIVTLMVSNQSALSARNQTLARTLINERLNRVMGEENVEVVTDEPVKLWQIDEDGNSVEIEGVLNVSTETDQGSSATQKVVISLTYTVAGRDITHEVQTIRRRSS